MQRGAIGLAAPLAFGIVMSAGQPAFAACTPQSASGITATCTGTTINQGGAAPGGSDGVGIGYGTTGENAITVNVGSAATVTGDLFGIGIQSGTVTNSGSITGTTDTGLLSVGDVTVTNNAGASITGFITGISSGNNITVTNNAGASITGQGGYGITGGPSATVINSGSINGYISGLNVTVTNNAGATITSSSSTIDGSAVTVINSGTIAGTVGIGAANDATVTNNLGASITGGQDGILQSNVGMAAVINSGSIRGTTGSGIHVATTATVTNYAGGSITGGQDGIHAEGFFGAVNTGAVSVTNSGSVAGTGRDGIYANTNATVTNNAGGSITGAVHGIYVNLGAASVVNSGSITGTTGAGVRAATSATVTNNPGGSITGAQYGISAGAGGSSVFNAGAISGGTAAIQYSGTGNSLTLAPGSVITGNVLGTGSDTFQLGGSGTANFDVSQLGAAAQYRGFGTFNKIDSSTWTLTGTSTFGGAVNVNGGTLSVNGDLSSASSLTVNAGAMLGGNGIVGNTTINGGTLSPGNSIGLLTVKGNLVFTAASSYLVEVSSTNADRTNVTGTATLGGATVNAALVAGTTQLSQRYTILNATGGVVGTFNQVVTTTPLPADLRASLSYDTNDAYLSFSLDFGGGLNANQQNVAGALTSFFNAGGNLPLAFASLTPAGLTQLSGESATGSQQTTFGAMSQFMGVLTDPFMGRGNGINGATSPTGYADEEGEASAYAERKKSDAFAMFTKAPPVPFVPRWSVWAAGYGGSQTTNGNTVLGSNDTASRIAGTAVGADYLFSPDTLAGFALAGGGTSFSVNNLGSGRSDLFQAGAYVRHAEGNAYVTGALAYGWQDITTNRMVSTAGLDQLRAEFNANAYSGRVEGGYRFVAPWTGGIGVTPYAAGQFTTFDLPAYAESVVTGTPNFALAYAAKSVTDARSELGIRSDKSFAMANGILTLRGRLAWAHDFDPDRSIGATFQALPGASFVVNGAAQASDSALTTASVEMKWTSGWSAAATFEGEFSNVTASYAGKGVVRYVW